MFSGQGKSVAILEFSSAHQIHLLETVLDESHSLFNYKVAFNSAQVGQELAAKRRFKESGEEKAGNASAADLTTLAETEILSHLVHDNISYFSHAFSHIVFSLVHVNAFNQLQ